jgi:hypothetical protein
MGDTMITHITPLSRCRLPEFSAAIPALEALAGVINVTPQPDWKWEVEDNEGWQK